MKRTIRAINFVYASDTFVHVQFVEAISDDKTRRIQDAKNTVKRGARWGAFIPWPRTNSIETLYTIFIDQLAMLLKL